MYKYFVLLCYDKYIYLFFIDTSEKTGTRVRVFPLFLLH